MHSKISKYVFVVCGSSTHIRTLNCSIQYLRKFSDKEIIVITDLSRNSTTIQHDLVQNIKTPKKFTHHQAAIYLKTGLTRFLDMSPNIEYCYLDTDVIAVRPGIDQVFSYFEPPVTFATDHGNIKDFSPYAIHDYQKRQHLERQQYLKKLLHKYREIEKNIRIRSQFQKKQIKEITKKYQDNLPENIFEAEKNWSKTQTLYFETYYPKGQFNPFIFFHNYFLLHQRILHLSNLSPSNLSAKLLRFFLKFPHHSLHRILVKCLQILLPFSNHNWRKKISSCLNADQQFLLFFSERGFKFDKERKKWISKNGHPLFLPEYDFHFYTKQHGYQLNTEEKVWYTLEGELIEQDFSLIKAVEAESGFHWNIKKHCWKDNEEEIMRPHQPKNLLVQQIKEKFGVQVEDHKWTHWNGGVFLFDYRAKSFFKTWQKYSTQIFRDPIWKPRDQGTLIATVWKLGLQNHIRLPIEFNFITDYYLPNLVYKGGFHFYQKDKKREIIPYFLHIYHHFGDNSWPLWQDIEKLIDQN